MTGRVGRSVRRWRSGRVAIAAAQGYTRHATSQLAAAISYRVLFSLVPLAAFLVALADAALPDEQRDAVARWLVSMVPGSALDSTVERSLTGSRVPPTAAGVVSLFVLLWAASAMMAAIRIAFRVIWENDLRRAYVRSKLLDFALVLGVGVLAVASIGATLLVQTIAELGRNLTGGIGAGTEGQVLATAAELLASTTLTFVVLVVLYRTVPPTAPRLRTIWLPAVLVAVGFHLLTAAYAFYLARYGDVSALYGPLAAIVGFLLVVHVGMIVILVGAELVAASPGNADSGHAVPVDVNPR